MKLKSPALALTVVLGGLLITPLGIAQDSGAKPTMGHATTPRHGRMYDPKTVHTVTGEVTAVEQVTPMGGMAGGDHKMGMMGRMGGVHLQLKTDKETLAVHLGPSSFLDKQDVQVKVGDKVEVTGSLITFDGKPALVAAEVKKGDQVLKLRDANGVPVWGGHMPH